MLRISKSLAENDLFDEIHIIALYEEGLKQVEILDERRIVFRIKNVFHTTNPKSYIRYLTLLEWNLRIFFRYLFCKVVSVNPHSVPALPVSYFLKVFKRCLLIYDTHEIETEQYVGNGITKKISKFFERSFINKVDHIFVTSDGYGSWYRNAYDFNRVTVVKNYPYRRDLDFDHGSIIRKRFNLESDDIIFIYQGLIAFGRGLELLLEVFRNISAKKHLVFMGYGPQAELVRELSQTISNIHFLPAVKPEEVFKYVMGVDIGFCLIEDSFISYRYTLPNKLLEGLNVGVPVIVSDFPDMSAVIREYDAGWVIDVSVPALQRLVQTLTREEIDRKKNNARKWAAQNSWDDEAAKMIQVYEALIS
jgi:glycosyltransferase involved in cell wall biosynthesis